MAILHRVIASNTKSRPRQNVRHFADGVCKCIFLNANVCILIKNSPKFVLKGPINNITALVQIMAWHRPGDTPLSELMMVSFLTHVCVTQPQCVKHPDRITASLISSYILPWYIKCLQYLLHITAKDIYKHVRDLYMLSQKGIELNYDVICHWYSYINCIHVIHSFSLWIISVSSI